MEVPIELRQKIVEFLTNIPNIHDNQVQRVLLYSAGLDEALLNQLPIGRPPTQFVELLVSTCVKYGKLNDGRHSLEAVLEAAKKYIGQDGRAFCDTLIQEHEEHRTILQSNQIDKDATDKEQRVIEESEHDTDIDNVREAAQTNPRVAVIRLSALIERELRAIVTRLGLPGPQTPTRGMLTSNKLAPSEMTPVGLGKMLVGHNFLPQSTTKSLETFWQLYERIIHGRENIHDDTILGILDSGMVLLGRIRSIPHEIHVVHQSSIDLYSDEQCTVLYHGVKGLILESTTIGKTRTYKRIFPTTNWQYYQPGKQVTWEWNLMKSWKEAWYIDPDTSERKVAWTSAGEFVGRHVEELA